MARADIRRAMKDAEAIELGIGERLQLLGLTQGMTSDSLSIRAVRVFREELSFEEAERAEIGLQSVSEPMPDGRNRITTKWGLGDWKPKRIMVPKRAREMLKEVLESMDKKKQLSLELLPLYDLFVSTSMNGQNAETPKGDDKPPES